MDIRGSTTDIHSVVFLFDCDSDLDERVDAGMIPSGKIIQDSYKHNEAEAPN